MCPFQMALRAIFGPILGPKSPNELRPRITAAVDVALAADEVARARGHVDVLRVQSPRGDGGQPRREAVQSSAKFVIANNL